MADDVYDRVSELITLPHGIILVTGPTGSGKTTTLYSSLLKIKSPETKIITTEDPVEYQLEGINQIQVHPKIGLTFASSLRSILRHDPVPDEGQAALRGVAEPLPSAIRHVPEHIT